MKRPRNRLIKDLHLFCLIGVIALGLITIVSIGGCGGGGGDGSEPEPGVLQPTVESGIIMGQVKDTQGNGLAGVEVDADGQNTATNEQGFFTLENIDPNNRLLVVFSKEGYCTVTKVTKIEAGLSYYLKPVLAAYEKTESLDAGIGGTVTTPDGGEVILGANTLVDEQGNIYQGNVTVSLTTFDPTTEAGLASFPGEFEGVLDDGTTVFFVSYGFMDVTVKGEQGEDLQLAANETADIAIPYPASLSATAPDSIPLWFFDETDGKWHEHGQGTKDGSVYRGEVEHFSVYNCDLTSLFSYLQGRVVDASGNPVKGAQAQARGAFVAGVPPFLAGETSTPDDGFFSLTVAADSPAKVYASKGDATSELTDVQTASRGGIQDVGDIYLSPPKIKAILTWGNNPEDLDFHLTIPLADGTRFHLYYPYSQQENLLHGARLDTDDRDGKGPEIITIAELNDGVYRFSVHHYRGTGTLTGSGASFNMVVDGQGISNFTPPTGGQGEKDVWTVCDVTVANGQVVSVTPINTIKHNVVSSDEPSFSP